jgi:hypothetical protein
MHTTILRALAAVMLAAVQLNAVAQEGVRLLPETFAKTIGVQWKQDGRAIDLKFSNPAGTWVITSVSLEVRFQPTKTPYAGELKPDKTGRMVLVPPKPGVKVEEYWAEQDPEKPILKVEIQPGKDAPSVHELKFNSAVAGITILEAGAWPRAEHL